jgi:hypothetical protein
MEWLAHWNLRLLRNLWKWLTRRPRISIKNIGIWKMGSLVIYCQELQLCGHSILYMIIHCILVWKMWRICQ